MPPVDVETFAGAGLHADVGAACGGALPKGVEIVFQNRESAGVAERLQPWRNDGRGRCHIEIDKYVNYQAKPDFKKIGPKFGPLAPKIKAALAKHADLESLVKALEQDGKCTLEIGGKPVELAADEVAIELHAKEGWAAERIPGCGILVLDTQMTPDLVDEGIARDLINQVQQARKNLDLRYEQRIDLAVLGGEDIRRVINTFGKYIMGETLAQAILSQAIPGAESVKTDIEGHGVEIHVKPL